MKQLFYYQQKSMVHLYINRQNRTPNKPPGVVLLAILWMIIIIAMVVGLYTELGWKKIREKAIVHNPDEMRSAAYSALEISLAVISEHGEVDGGVYGPQQGWGNPLAYSGVTISDKLNINVTISDETAKIPLFSEDVSVLAKVFESMEIDSSDSLILINSLADWMDEDDATRPSGAEEAYYEFDDPEVLPPNRRISDYDELRYIRGFYEIFFDEETGQANELLIAFAAITSLHHQLPVNINTASSNVLDALYNENYPPGLESAIYDIRGDDGEPGTEDDEFSTANIGDKLLGNTVGMLKILVEVRKGDAIFTLTALVEIGGSSSTQNQNNRSRGTNSTSQAQSYPFTILKLLENEKLI